jgi:hypothetical protein
MTLVSTEVHLRAIQAATVPEIDGSSIGTGLGLLTAGILIVRSRGRRAR